MKTKSIARIAGTLVLFSLASVAHGATTVPTAVYRAYFNGELQIRSVMTEAAALANCTLNHENNPSRTIRCLWGEKEIYRAAGKAEYKLYINSALRGTALLVTRADARANCEANHKNNAAASVRCTWNGEVIYDKGPLIPVADLREYINGTLFLTSLGLGKAAALARCTFDHSTNFPTKSMRCTWGAVVIYDKAPLR